jgi:hypothetical protein
MRQDSGLDIQKLIQLIEEAVSQGRKESSLIISYLQECQQFGIDVLPLDINKSLAVCALENEHAIRIGFSLLVSREEQFLEDLLIERQQHGPFCSFQDFCERINLDLVPEQFMMRCIQAGAFDAVEVSRSRAFANQARILQAVRQANAEKSSGQISLFAVLPPSSTKPNLPLTLTDPELWTDDELIIHEKEAAGFSFTEYLLRSEEDNSREAEVAESENEPGKEPRLIGQEGTNQVLEASKGPEIIDETIPLPPAEFTVDEMETFEDVESIGKHTKTAPPIFIIQLSTPKTTEQTLIQLREIAKKYPGSSRLILEFIDETGKKTHIQTHTDYAVHISAEFVQETESITNGRVTAQP